MIHISDNIKTTVISFVQSGYAADFGTFAIFDKIFGIFNI